MASPSMQPDHANEGEGDSTIVRRDSLADELEMPPPDEQILSLQPPRGYTAEDDLPGLTLRVDHSQRFPQTTHPEPNEVNGVHSAPFNVDSSGVGESTAIGSTSSDPQSDGILAHPLITTMPPGPIHLTPASLDASIMPGFTYDIQAWLNGDPSCWLPATDDHARAPPVGRAPTRHSSNGSFGFVFVPAQPCSVGRDVQGAGTKFEGAVAYSSQLELD
ncbi:hypothetical protein VPNG_00282 [Cytospora leucostoma]|uniref:Uncharacterized protein n=1 Tax=Cytospora leucostoma TaxID=1230097 RepID=A0A423XNI7_9PEZI|nr:hypothetical protein VPNG_00282 [Cytospora leucostoma]